MPCMAVTLRGEEGEREGERAIGGDASRGEEGERGTLARRNTFSWRGSAPYVLRCVLSVSCGGAHTAAVAVEVDEFE